MKQKHDLRTVKIFLTENKSHWNSCIICKKSSEIFAKVSFLAFDRIPPLQASCDQLEKYFLVMLKGKARTVTQMLVTPQVT